MSLKPSQAEQFRRSKKLSDIKNDFERGVFLVVYNSRKQKLRRLLAAMFLSLKHGLRGLLFSWPLYLLALAATTLPGQASWVFIVLLVPAVMVSWRILSRGIREDYQTMIEGSLLQSGFLGRMIFHKKV